MRRRKKHTYLPYFNAGMIGFPERSFQGKRFAEIWYETALIIDEIEGLHKRRPYLDQMSLPPTIQKAGLTWRRLEEVDQYILGGRIRGKPLPDLPIKAIHYRHPQFLQEIGEIARAMAPVREYADAIFPGLMDPFLSYLGESLDPAMAEG